MNPSDIELVAEEPGPGGDVVYTIRVPATGQQRRYRRDAATGNLQLIDDPWIVGGHDMTSIIGVRVRDWLAARE